MPRHSRSKADAPQTPKFYAILDNAVKGVRRPEATRRFCARNHFARSLKPNDPRGPKQKPRQNLRARYRRLSHRRISFLAPASEADRAEIFRLFRIFPTGTHGRIET